MISVTEKLKCKIQKFLYISHSTRFQWKKLLFQKSGRPIQEQPPFVCMEKMELP